MILKQNRRLLFVLLLFVSACSTQPHVIKKTDISVSGATEIYIVRQGLHTGFVIPASIIQSQIPQLKSRFGDSPYLEFGWGDKDYYQTKEVTSGITLKAVLWPTGTVVRVIAIPERPDIYFTDNEVEILCLDSEQYSRLMSFIEESFNRGSDRKIINSKDGYEGDSQFYKGVGGYHLFNTCNNWTAKGLKTAGLDISLAFKFGPGSVMGYLARHEDVSTGRCGL